MKNAKRSQQVTQQYKDSTKHHCTSHHHSATARLSPALLPHLIFILIFIKGLILNSVRLINPTI